MALFLKNKNISQLNELDRFRLHQELETFLPSFIFYLPQNLHLDWLKRWRDKEDKLFHPSNLINGDVIQKKFKNTGWSYLRRPFTVSFKGACI